MANWLDELERKKKEESDSLRAEARKRSQRYEAEQHERERKYELIKGRVEPIFARLEALVDRANNNDFFLIAQRGPYGHQLKIFRYDAEDTRVDIGRRGELLIGKVTKRAKGNEEYLKGVAEVTLYPESHGLSIWFVEARINMGWKNGKWYDKSEIDARLRECVGTVPYDRMTEDRMLELIKWIATGKEPIPHFQGAIPYKKWEPDKKWEPSPAGNDPGGCLYSSSSYILPIGIILLYLFLSLQK